MVNAIVSFLSGGYTGWLFWIALFAGIVGLSFILGQFLKIKIFGIITKPFAKWRNLILIAAVVLVVLPAFSYTLVPKTLSIGGSTSDQSNLADSGSCVRPTGGNTANQLFAVRNMNNPATTYLANSIILVGADGTIYNTGSTNAGTSLSYATVTTTPCVSGTVYVLTNSSTSMSFSSNQPQDQNTIPSALGTNMNAYVVNYNTGANATANGAVGTSTGTGEGSAGTAIVASNLTLASGGAVNFKYQFTAATANAEFGAYNNPAGVIVGVYISNLAKFSSTGGVTLSGIDNGASLTPVACPTDVATNLRLNKCWSTSSMLSGRTYQITGTYNADLGDPSGSDYIDMYVVDEQFFKDTNEKIVFGAYNLAGTDQGATNTQIRQLFN